jgi:hypothetical protein
VVVEVEDLLLEELVAVETVVLLVLQVLQTQAVVAVALTM